VCPISALGEISERDRFLKGVRPWVLAELIVGPIHADNPCGQRDLVVLLVEVGHEIGDSERSWACRTIERRSIHGSLRLAELNDSVSIAQHADALWL